ncbi:MAG: hypothetical protein PHR61_00330 [Candidatus Absconditabacteria bacterium]|nr:hypothetical protein [Candidatus Absconditabacteria bacterium]
MFYLRYEYLSESFPRCNVFKVRDNKELLHYTIHEDLSSIVRQSSEYPRYEHFFLLDESRFSFFRCDVNHIFEEEITIHTLNELLKEKIRETKNNHQIGGEVVMSHIDTIFVDGQEKKFLIGQKGQIFFRLYIVFLAKTSLNIFDSVYGKTLDKKNINLIPQSLYTLLFLRNNLKKENFVLLYITESYAKAITVKDGFYDGIDVLNLGLGSLKQMYKDNGVVQYRYKEYQAIEANPLAKELVVETLEFYSQLFCKRLLEKNLGGMDIIVISPITKNEHFIETFNKEYRKMSNNYIVPFHHSNSLNSFGKEREPEDMDSLVFVNQEDKIRKFILGE